MWLTCGFALSCAILRHVEAMWERNTDSFLCILIQKKRNFFVFLFVRVEANAFFLLVHLAVKCWKGTLLWLWLVFLPPLSSNLAPDSACLPRIPVKCWTRWVRATVAKASNLLTEAHFSLGTPCDKNNVTKKKQQQKNNKYSVVNTHWVLQF